MVSQRWRPLFVGAVALAAIWLLALAGYSIARSLKVTPDKVRAYVTSVDLSKLSSSARAKAIAKLASMLNALSLEERRQARLEQLTTRWFEQMTEEEKGQFIDATMPTGFKQMLTAFEQLPEDKRRRTIEDAMRRLKQAQKEAQSRAPEEGGNTNGPVLSPELEARVRTIGLQAFYSQSSAQTKAELAPVLEELQRVMESGRPFRGR
jgi:hypothetical protein